MVGEAAWPSAPPEPEPVVRQGLEDTAVIRNSVQMMLSAADFEEAVEAASRSNGWHPLDPEELTPANPWDEGRPGPCQELTRMSTPGRRPSMVSTLR